MAVTTQKSTEYTNRTATPVSNNKTTEEHGKLRIMFKNILKFTIQSFQAVVAQKLLNFKHFLEDF